MAAETWAIAGGNSRTVAENALADHGYTVSSHAITPANWNGHQLIEIINLVRANGAELTFTPSSGQVTPETFAITGNNRVNSTYGGGVENYLAKIGFTVSSHNVTPGTWKSARLLELINTIQAGGCRLAYTKSS